ncbi:Apd1p [Kluyveromyces lactis]|uniref:KLLA0F02772p n=1 Tax=Kluyveromyces lactis (strain ATCC 8585 / CBS 2359 / DSM 70799 / NBRC 1267 / NRRL Y-1140 / WM37) TaxID=284590 RepID=Q6CLI4_KLULA|nr:uncharacterized protein KLLA0_F02772g [Kluyveromyces lactis]CAG97913.1 KLLA0F02772p [Kluyveromyces lactis]|eukprot:XP_455205.1 uncharacterized protein KLLA0_F02772g [Kluyveromyces lactis]
MGLIKLLKGFSLQSEADSSATVEKIKEAIDVCDSSECTGDCVNEDADEKDALQKDEGIFAKLKIDHEQPLYGSSTTSKIHFIIPTSQTDWAHDACMEKPGSVQAVMQKWINANSDKYSDIESEGETIRCSVSSLPIDLLDIDVMKNTKNDVLIFPHFLKIKAVKSDLVAELLNEVVPLLLKNERGTLLAKDYIEEIKDNSFILLCSHRTRDKRCGITAPILEKHFNKHLQRHHLYRDNSDFRPGGCRVAYVNHVGGHKFAANVIIYLKKTHQLIWLGRVTPLHAEPLIECLIVPNEPKLPYPEKVRCVAKYKF